MVATRSEAAKMTANFHVRCYHTSTVFVKIDLKEIWK